MTKPGSGGGSPGAPGDFVYAKFQRFSTDPSIAKLPTNQRAWNYFLQQMDKAFFGESDGWVPTFTGFSADPSNPFCWYQRHGQVVMIEFHFGTGTSNAAAFGIENLPEVITPYTTQTVLVRGLVDAGSTLTTGSAEIRPDGTIEFYSPDHPETDLGSQFTNSGDKGFATDLLVEPMSIMYFLRNPNKA